MVARRVHGGKTSEVKVTALRAVKSGHLHEAGGGRVGYYCGDQEAATGDTIVLHCDEHLELDAASTLVKAVGDVVNFNFTTQEAVASGGTNCGRATAAKASGETLIQVALNNSAGAVA